MKKHLRPWEEAWLTNNCNAKDQHPRYILQKGLFGFFPEHIFHMEAHNDTPLFISTQIHTETESRGGASIRERFRSYKSGRNTPATYSYHFGRLVGRSVGRSVTSRVPTTSRKQKQAHHKGMLRTYVQRVGGLSNIGAVWVWTLTGRTSSEKAKKQNLALHAWIWYVHGCTWYFFRDGLGLVYMTRASEGSHKTALLLLFLVLVVFCCTSFAVNNLFFSVSSFYTLLFVLYNSTIAIFSFTT